MLDEITASLDPEIVREALDVVIGLTRGCMTMAVVTHGMAFARVAAGRVIDIAPTEGFTPEVAARTPRQISVLKGRKSAGRCGYAQRFGCVPATRLGRYFATSHQHTSSDERTAEQDRQLQAHTTSLRQVALADVGDLEVSGCCVELVRALGP